MTQPRAPICTSQYRGEPGSARMLDAGPRSHPFFPLIHCSDGLQAHRGTANHPSHTARQGLREGWGCGPPWCLFAPSWRRCGYLHLRAQKLK